MTITLPATQASFTGWVPHAEVGSGEGGGEQAGGESGPDGPEGPESGTEAAMEAAMSSPITPLDQTWNGALGGLAISASYDAATQTVHTTAQNTTQQTLCYVQIRASPEVGNADGGRAWPRQAWETWPPDSRRLPAWRSPPSLSLRECRMTGTSFTWRCSTAAAPVLWRTRAAKAALAREPAARGTVPAARAAASPPALRALSPAALEAIEGSGAMLAPDETFDMVRGGARLVMSYDASLNAFTGMVQNTTANTLTNVRIEVHLSNGVELGPTTPVDMAPGEAFGIILPATPEAFTGWVPHAEVGSGEGGGEHGSGASGGEGRGEHGSGGEGKGGN